MRRYFKYGFQSITNSNSIFIVLISFCPDVQLTMSIRPLKEGHNIHSIFQTPDNATLTIAGNLGLSLGGVGLLIFESGREGEDAVGALPVRFSGGGGGGGQVGGHAVTSVAPQGALQEVRDRVLAIPCLPGNDGLQVDLLLGSPGLLVTRRPELFLQEVLYRLAHAGSALFDAVVTVQVEGVLLALKRRGSVREGYGHVVQELQQDCQKQGLRAVPTFLLYHVTYLWFLWCGPG